MFLAELLNIKISMCYEMRPETEGRVLDRPTDPLAVGRSVNTRSNEEHMEILIFRSSANRFPRYKQGDIIYNKKR
jgi:hypothetical protein